MTDHQWIRLPQGAARAAQASTLLLLLFTLGACMPMSQQTLKQSTAAGPMQIDLLTSMDTVLLGVPIGIEVVATPGEDVDALGIAFELSPGLELAGHRIDPLKTGPLKAGEKANQLFAVLPTNTTPQFLRLTITSRREAQSTQRELLFALTPGMVAPHPVAWRASRGSTARLALMASAP